MEAEKLPLLLHTLWEKSEGVIPVYIDLTEDTQRKAERVQVKISDSLLVAVTSDALLGKNFYPRECNDWEGLATADLLWDYWKK